jgi:cell division protein FtsB
MDNTLYDELKDYNQGNQNRQKLLTYVIATMLFGLYIGILFYGSNSINVLIGLSDKEELLNKEIVRLKKENSKLQQKYFDLVSLNPEGKN